MGPFVGDILTLLELAAVAALAASGALAGMTRRLDIIWVCLLALVVGLAGGSLRDLLTGAPVFWIGRPLFLAAALAAAGVVWATGERAARGRAIVWLDAAALPAYAAVSAARAAEAGVTPLAAGVVGVLAAAVGVLAREALGGEGPSSRWSGLHLSAAVAAAAVFVLLRFTPLDTGLCALAGAVVGWGLRAAQLTPRSRPTDRG